MPAAGLSDSSLETSCHSVSNHLLAPAVALTRHPSARQTSRASSVASHGSGVRHSLAGSPAQPTESSSHHITDWPFTSSCSPPGLAATRLLSVTGRRTYARKGLAPFCFKRLSDALGWAYPVHRLGLRGGETAGGIRLPYLLLSERRFVRYGADRRGFQGDIEGSGGGVSD